VFIYFKISALLGSIKKIYKKKTVKKHVWGDVLTVKKKRRLFLIIFLEFLELFIDFNDIDEYKRRKQI